jgi:CheY-like chemotaxis protein
MQTMCDVLIVDDSLAIGLVVQQVLALEGYSAMHVRHGSEALAWLAAHRAPRMVVVDLCMPEMDGPTFIAQVQAQPAWRTLPILVMTAEPDFAARLGDLPVVGVLVKPFGMDDLLRHVQRQMALPAVA